MARCGHWTPRGHSRLAAMLLSKAQARLNRSRCGAFAKRIPPACRQRKLLRVKDRNCAQKDGRVRLVYWSATRQSPTCKENSYTKNLTVMRMLPEQTRDLSHRRV